MKVLLLSVIALLSQGKNTHAEMPEKLRRKHSLRGLQAEIKPDGMVISQLLGRFPRQICDFLVKLASI